MLPLWIAFLTLVCSTQAAYVATTSGPTATPGLRMDGDDNGCRNDHACICLDNAIFDGIGIRDDGLNSYDTFEKICGENTRNDCTCNNGLDLTNLFTRNGDGAINGICVDNGLLAALCQAPLARDDLPQNRWGSRHRTRHNNRRRHNRNPHAEFLCQSECGKLCNYEDGCQRRCVQQHC